MRAHWRGEIFNWMSHIGKQAVWEEANRRVSLREGWQYQQGSVKMDNKTVSSWFRALTFLPISEQDEIFSVLTISAAMSKPRCFSTLMVKKIRESPECC